MVAVGVWAADVGLWMVAGGQEEGEADTAAALTLQMAVAKRPKRDCQCLIGRVDEAQGKCCVESRSKLAIAAEAQRYNQPQNDLDDSRRYMVQVARVRAS